KNKTTDKEINQIQKTKNNEKNEFSRKLPDTKIAGYRILFRSNLTYGLCGHRSKIIMT
ncbi:hypothetical protein DERP_008379, partial [Dermatophagoides pteronyssinus]